MLIDIVCVGAPQIAVNPFRIVEVRRVIFPYFEQKRPMILRHEKRDVAVLALEEIGWRIVLVLAAGALHHTSFR